ncbi:MAG: hypothetical protein CM1200mP37_5270 [Chloroflexota bacterium]|nr:MAG: hypothetical protein CM1200mP37_5270 [Chloroflexota bacterium]
MGKPLLYNWSKKKIRTDKQHPKNPLYVTYIDPNTKKLYWGQNLIYIKVLSMLKISTLFQSIPPKNEPIRISAKIRYKSSKSPGYLYTKKSSVSIKFDQPQKSITPGQAIVFYNQNEVIGGGIIK